MSARGSTAKISSLSSMSPPLPASRVCTLTFILAFLALVTGFAFRLRLARGSVRCFILGSSLGFRLGSGAGFLLGGDGRDFIVARQRRDLVHRTLVDEARRSMLFGGLRLRGFDERGRVRRALVARQLDGVADRQPSALVAGDRTLDEQEAADRVRADDLEVLLSTVPSTHVPGHLLVLEDATRILAVAGR